MILIASWVLVHRVLPESSNAQLRDPLGAWGPHCRPLVGDHLRHDTRFVPIFGTFLKKRLPAARVSLGVR